MNVLINLPVLLAIALFIGIIALVKVLLSPNCGLERRMHVDRRSGAPLPGLPFHDTQSGLIAKDRRFLSRPDRRKRVYVISMEHKRV